jgi:hypothetical protein
MPIEPVDSSKSVSGEGREKYDPDLKRGPGKFDEILDKAKVDRAKAEISKMAEETRLKAEAERPRTYTERLQDMGRLPRGGGGGSGGIPKLNRDITKSYKRGGNVSSASKRADGIAIRGRTKI